MSLGTTERAACEELALAPGTEFEGLFRFLPMEEQESQLSLEALLRSLRDIPLGVSDPSVGIAKLAWWQQELATAPTAGSQHPVVRALLESGALEAMDQHAFGDYLHALVTELQEEPPVNGGELQARLIRSAGAEARVRAGQGSLSAGQLEAAGAAARLLELMRTLARGPRRDSMPVWLPMDLVARHQLRGSGGDDPREQAPVVADLAGMALGWRTTQPLETAEPRTPGERLLVMRDALVGRRLRQASTNPKNWLRRGGLGGLGDVFSTWRLARRLARAPQASRGSAS
ncbi:MAG: squalene/phytoene synthase family protein [Xanthomonadales bacterium]|jgi:hypothetical protein|nr:squalene/phytoene synthase family protein [Xanthomonadales bacterium]